MWLLQHTPSLTSRQERDLHRVASTSSVQHLSARSFERLRMQRRFVRCDRHRDTIHGTKSLWLHTAFPLHCLCAVCVWVLHLSLAVYTVVAILIAQSLPQLLPPAPGRPRPGHPRVQVEGHVRREGRNAADRRCVPVCPWRSSSCGVWSHAARPMVQRAALVRSAHVVDRVQDAKAARRRGFRVR